MNVVYLQAASVGILPFSVEDPLVEIDVVAVDGSVESDGDHLRHLSGIDVSWNSCSIGGTEAVGQLALAEVAVGRAVGILVYCAGVLVRTIGAVRALIAEELLVNALPIAALQLTIRTHGFVCLQVGKSLAGF